ncbi:hypothetical protein [Sulfoacidibacillus ferrooxidans]|uniref:Uncharacterized protein n=1 Tax=Sulfoacidibacillus ferrooxidans TaxID=2005001 RepID=A0A9X1VAY4_9BACL|nr:hypothetical protein [Sulfoacidibacillus ferrooxidans]
MTATIERQGIATIEGNDITLVGPELHVGDPAPAFTVNKDLITEDTLADYHGKIMTMH